MAISTPACMARTDPLRRTKGRPVKKNAIDPIVIPAAR